VQTISEAIQQQQREEAERRYAEWRDRAVSVLALGGLAVLVGTAAVAGAAVAGQGAAGDSSGGRDFKEVRCDYCNGTGRKGLPGGRDERCHSCGGHGVKRSRL